MLEGSVDTGKVRVLETTPSYFDYNWRAASDVDEKIGDGFTRDIQAALVALSAENNSEILNLFSTERFIATENSNYEAIEEVAKDLGIIK